MTTEKRPLARRRVGTIIWWLILPLALGLLLSTLVPRPIVGLIYLDGPIGSFSARNLVAQIAYAREHWEVRSVVLVMNSRAARLWTPNRSTWSWRACARPGQWSRWWKA